MKLIFITRKLHQGDSMTGFVFGWIERLAKNLDKLYVICQEKGDITGLPDNVEVHSFGKEKGYGRLRQGYELFVMSYKFGRQADGFFVHMHPIYAITAWLPAKLRRKKIALWYTHKAVDLKLRVAHALVDWIFTASRESFRLRSDKVKVVGHGIDLNKFKKKEILRSAQNDRDNKFRIVSVGRISPVKDYETLIKAAEILRDKGVKGFSVDIYGKIGLAKHQSYLDSLLEFIHNAALEDWVKFQGGLDYKFVDEIYREADLFVNLSATGSLDKAVLEAAASGTLVLTSNEAFFEPLQKISKQLFFERDNPDHLAEQILYFKNLAEPMKQNLQAELVKWVRTEHDLDRLVQKILAVYQS